MFRRRTERDAAEHASRRPTDVLVELRDTDVIPALDLLGVVAPRPVVVVIGGAGGLDDEIQKDSPLARRLRQLLDQGLVPAAEVASAVIVTGGTDSGVMKLVGELSRERSVTLVGVAPRSRVRHAEETLPEEGRTRLNPDHHRFLLTRGDDWGSESDVLFALAERVTGGRSTGVVLLANGGGVARYECRRFLDAGWPVLVLAGTGRAADDLARHLNQRSRLASVTELLGSQSRADRAWGPVRDLDAEVHALDDSAALLRRRLTWRLSAENSLRAAWSTYDTYDRAASAGKRLDRHLRLTTAGAALLLASAALVLGLDDAYANFRWLVVTLPLALVLLSALQDSVLPTRGHIALRHASEAALSAIWLYVAARPRCCTSLHIESPPRTPWCSAATTGRASMSLGPRALSRASACGRYERVLNCKVGSGASRWAEAATSVRCRSGPAARDRLGGCPGSRRS